MLLILWMINPCLGLISLKKIDHITFNQMLLYFF